MVRSGRALASFLGLRGQWDIQADSLIEDGAQHLVLDNGLELPCPVRILQGEGDADVPWQHALKTYHALTGDDVTFELIKHGDHRLSSEHNLALLAETAEALCAYADTRLLA